jgi:hypothetical protein
MMRRVLVGMMVVALTIGSGMQAPVSAALPDSGVAAGAVTWTTQPSSALPQFDLTGPLQYTGVWSAGGATYNGAATMQQGFVKLGHGPYPGPTQVAISSVTPGGLSGVCAGFSPLSVGPVQNIQYFCTVQIQGGPLTSLDWGIVGIQTAGPDASGVAHWTGVFASPVSNVDDVACFLLVPVTTGCY